MSDQKTPGQVSWTARNMALAGPAENPADALARLDAAWDYLTPGQQEAEEAGAQAVLDNRTPWGDADVVMVEQNPWFAVIRSGGHAGPVVKVIAFADGKLRYFDRLCGHRASQGGTRYSCERPPHPVDGYGPRFRHAAGIDAEFARRHADDERGEPDLVTWGEDEQGGDQDWEVAWGTVAGYAAREGR